MEGEKDPVPAEAKAPTGAPRAWMELAAQEGMHPDAMADAVFSLLSRKLPALMGMHLRLALDKEGGEVARKCREYLLGLFFVQEKDKALPPWINPPTKPPGAVAFSVAPDGGEGQ